MGAEAVQLTVAGQTCRVLTSANEEELQELAALVENKIAALGKTDRPVTKQTMLLVAIALAHDVQEQRMRADAISSRAKAAFSRVLARVDKVMHPSDASAEQQQPCQPAAAAQSIPEQAISEQAASKRAASKRAGKKSTASPTAPLRVSAKRDLREQSKGGGEP